VSCTSTHIAMIDCKGSDAGQCWRLWWALAAALALGVTGAAGNVVSLTLRQPQLATYSSPAAAENNPQQDEGFPVRDGNPGRTITSEEPLWRAGTVGSLHQDVSVIVYNPPSGYQEGDVGSPTIIRIPSDATALPGVLLAANDMVSQPMTQIHRSEDNGATWSLISTVRGSYWCSLYWHRGGLYLIGTSHEYGDVHVWHSEDIGLTWTVPVNASTGKLTSGEKWHRAPTPIVAHNGRLWHAMESMGEGMVWPSDLAAVMWSIDEDGDLLDASQWRTTNHLSFPRFALLGALGWLEGNAAVTPERSMAILIRVHNLEGGNAAIIDIDAEGKKASLNRFVSLPGGCKKFMIQQDPLTGRYWTLANTLVVDNPRGGVKLVLHLTIQEVAAAAAALPNLRPCCDTDVQTAVAAIRCCKPRPWTGATCSPSYPLLTSRAGWSMRLLSTTAL